ncbi:hypothetical protein BDV98DRAFT_560038 [Pterulicium gracile]|uniref:Uncharacterized protein n=1 Tax=Pterulicium gracile TaxID=1884261 RepID=A0A5C3R2F4_9AGAR|nr:hypothetical protein BDV98DRAFT_560038 [Pterula gracilis]
MVPRATIDCRRRRELAGQAKIEEKSRREGVRPGREDDGRLVQLIKHLDGTSTDMSQTVPPRDSRISRQRSPL